MAVAPIYLFSNDVSDYVAGLKFAANIICMGELWLDFPHRDNNNSNRFQQYVLEISGLSIT